MEDAGQPIIQANLLGLAAVAAAAALKIASILGRTRGKVVRRQADEIAKPKPTPQKPPEAPKPPAKPSAPKPKMNDTKTWPKPPKDGKLKEGTPSRSKPANRGEKSLYDEKGGEWRYAPEDKYHNEHWDYKPPGKDSPWENISIGDKPPVK